MSQKQILTTILKTAFLGFLAYFCLQFFIPRWEALQLSDRLGTLSGHWIIAAAVFTAIHYLLGLLIWSLILRKLGVQADPHAMARAYIFSLLAKYIPGNIVAHGVRTHVAMKAGLPITVLMKSFVLEAVFALGTAAVLSIPGTIYFFPDLLDGLSSLVFVLVALIVIAVTVAKRFTPNAITQSRLLAPTVIDIKLLSLYLLLWFVSGVAHWCLANALSDLDSSHLPQLIIAVSASWALGFISIFAPAGLGVREAVLYFFLRNTMDQTDVILFVTMSRLLMFGVEVLLTVGFLLYSKVVGPPATAMTKEESARRDLV